MLYIAVYLLKVLEKLENDDEVTYFYEKTVGFSSIDTENEYKPYLYIVEVNKSYFDELKLLEGRFPENDSELVISSHISSNGGVNYVVGDTISLDYGYREFDGEKIYINDAFIEGESLVVTDSRDYTIVGIVDRSNYEDYSASGYSVFTLNEKAEGDINLYTVFNKKSRIIKQAQDLAREINYDENSIVYNSALLTLYGESGYSNIKSSMVGMLVIMLSLVSIGCIIVIYNSLLYLSWKEKRIWSSFQCGNDAKTTFSYGVF